jgi:hypothetical protein
MRKTVPMRDALDDPALLGSILAGDTWRTWRTVLIAAMGEPLLRTPIMRSERALFRKLSGGRTKEPGKPVDELWAVVGRRGGKTRAAATLAVYLAALCDHSETTAPGERPLLLFLAQNQKQAGVAFGYAAGIFDSVPLLGQLVIHRTADTLSLSTGVDLEIRAASAKGLRGVTCAAVIADEAAFWNVGEESVNNDEEILAAVRPTLATTGGQLIVISSPYAQSGAVFQTYKDHYGAKGDPSILVVQGASRDFNPSLPQAVVDRELKRDPVRNTAEYLGQFRADVSNFVSAQIIDSCIVGGRHELSPRNETYVAFVDVSGGVRDSHCCGIAFKSQLNDTVTLACAREIKSSNTESVVAEFAALMRSYGLSTAWSDRYGSSWVNNAFERHGIRLQYSPKSRSELYLEMLPLLGTAQVRLLDLPRLRTQLLLLRRRTTRTGRDEVDHPAGGADDLSNAVSGACVIAAGATGNHVTYSILAGEKGIGPGGIVVDQQGPWPRMVSNAELPPPRLWPPSELDRSMTDWHLR